MSQIIQDPSRQQGTPVSTNPAIGYTDPAMQQHQQQQIRNMQNALHQQQVQRSAAQASASNPSMGAPAAVNPESGVVPAAQIQQMQMANSVGSSWATAGAAGGGNFTTGSGVDPLFHSEMSRRQQEFAEAMAFAGNYQYNLNPGTGIDAQLAQVQANYDRAASNRFIGFDYRGQEAYQANERGANLSQMVPQGDRVRGSSLDQMARDLADRYGLPLPRGQMVDENGTLLVTPDQVAAQSGGALTPGEAAIKMQFIENAITQQQNRRQQELGRGAISAGMQMVADRGRGSLAMMQSGFYQDLADLYSNQIEEAEDFSGVIQMEAMNIQAELQARAERLFRKQGRMMAIMGIANILGGAASGNAGMVVQGVGQTAAGGHGAGWW